MVIHYTRQTFVSLYFLELGTGWAPTILETEQEFNFLRGAMKLFVSSYDHPCYIGGSTTLQLFNHDYYTNRVIALGQFSQVYNTSDSGNMLSDIFIQSK